MNSNLIPEQLSLRLEGACGLALECWRLRRMAASLKEQHEAAALRYTVRKIGEILESVGIEIVDFAGRNYDSGMVPEVVEMREEEGTSSDLMVIDETIVPTVTWRGKVVEPGKIALRRHGSAK